MKEDRHKHIDRLNGEKHYLRVEDLFLYNSSENSHVSLQTLDELMARDNQREEDGFERKIKLGKIVRPSKNGSDEISGQSSSVRFPFVLRCKLEVLTSAVAVRGALQLFEWLNGASYLVRLAVGDILVGIGVRAECPLRRKGIIPLGYDDDEGRSVGRCVHENVVRLLVSRGAVHGKISD